MACAVLGACSSVRLAYNNAPTMGAWWLDRYLGLDEQQAQRLRQDLAQLQQWHRRTQLPELATLLRQAQDLAEQERIGAGQVCTLVRQVQASLGEVGDFSGTSGAVLAASLRPEQLTQMQARYERVNREFREEWLEPDAQGVRDKRYDKALERAEHLYGRLRDEQRALLRQQIDHSSFDPRLLQAERLRRQQDTVQTLQQLVASAATPEQAEAALRGLFSRYARSPDAGYRAYAQQQIDEHCSAAARLHNSATAEQRSHARERLLSYERDLRTLAAQR